MGITIEYKIPQSAKRVDVILTGQNHNHKDVVLLIELKQWQSIKKTNKDGVVVTYINGREQEALHPSYQVWSYATLLQDFSAVVEDEGIIIKPCAYLHNYNADGIINNDFYKEHLRKAPLFLRENTLQLKTFIRTHIRYGDRNKVLYRIDRGKMRPSKYLTNELGLLLKGNRQFVMIDDQKLVFEEAVALAAQSKPGKKHVLIVEGGPGTGKSVVALNLLASFLNSGRNARYVTKNAAPRAVYQKRLTGSNIKTRFSNLFPGSSSFTQTDHNEFDVLVVDEAHRLNAKSGMFQNAGENQIKELIHAATFTVFFLDEDQRVTLKDIGEKEEIKKWAKKAGAIVKEMILPSQFRCNGSDGYLS